jgi:hypothetical protein
MAELDIDYQWLRVEGAPGTDYTYPQAVGKYIDEHYSKPAVYRWAFFEPERAPSPQERQHPRAVYIGETENLAKRLRGYLHPGPSQMTNKRMKAYLDQELSLGTTIELSILRFEAFHIIIDRGRRGSRLVDEFRLSNPFIRKMMENFAAIVQDEVTCDILNKSMNPIKRREEKADKALRELTFSERWAEIERRLSNSKRAGSNR